jgi:hypothetical protein
MMNRMKARDVLGFIGAQHDSSSITLNDVDGAEGIDAVDIAKAIGTGYKSCKDAEDLLSMLRIAVRIAERDGMPGNPGSAPAWTRSAKELMERIEQQ